MTRSLEGVIERRGKPEISVAKNFKFTERQYLEFRGEFFNLPNHPIFGTFGAALGTSTFGVIGSAQIDSRQLQFGRKYVFYAAGWVRSVRTDIDSLWEG